MRTWLVLALCVCGCASVAFHGHDPARRRSVAIVAQAGAQWVELGGVARERWREVPMGELVFSADGCAMAHAARRGQSWHVVRDGQAGAPYDEVRGVQLDAHGDHLSYVARRGDDWTVALDGRELGDFDEIDARGASFTDDGIAFVARRGARWHVVDGEVVGPGFSAIGAIAIAGDGSRISYVAREGKHARVVVDGRIGPRHDDATAPVLADDGSRSAYLARSAAGWAVVVDGESQAHHPVIDTPVFSADARHIAYAFRDGEGAVVQLDDETYGPYAAVAPKSVRFDPDGRHAYWICGLDDAAHLCRDGVPGPAYERIELVTLAADRHGYVGVRGTSHELVIDGEIVERFAAVHDLAVVTGGFAVAGERGGRGVVRGPGRSFDVDAIVAGTLVLSADGRHFGLMVVDRARRRLSIRVDGLRDRPVDLDELAAATQRASDRGEIHELPATVQRPWVAAELARVSGEVHRCSAPITRSNRTRGVAVRRFAAPAP